MNALAPSVLYLVMCQRADLDDNTLKLITVQMSGFITETHVPLPLRKKCWGQRLKFHW